MFNPLNFISKFVKSQDQQINQELIQNYLMMGSMEILKISHIIFKAH